MQRSIGILLLCIFLALFGLLQISNVHFESERFILGALAIGSAIFLAVGK